MKPSIGAPKAATGQKPSIGAPKAAGAAAAKPPKITSPETKILVYTTATRDEVGIRTLAGEYKAEGSNHNRPVYRKMTKGDAIEVFLYFWDERDGVGFSGWWFGNKVGGEQVWSRNNQTKSPVPPKTGWTIPWDGEVKKELVVMSVNAKQADDKKEAMAQKAARIAEEKEQTTKSWEERVQHASEKAAECTIDVEEAMEDAKTALEGDLDEEVVKAAHVKLAALTKPLAETQRFIASENLAAAKAPPALKAEMAVCVMRVKKLVESVRDEMGKLKNAKKLKEQRDKEEEKRLEEESREAEREVELSGQHQKQLDEMMPLAMQKVDDAEDEVEKVAIAAAPLQMDTGDEIRPVMLQSIKDTETHVRTAQTAVAEAKRFIAGKLSQAQRFVSSVKKEALEEFTALQEKLKEHENKLTPYKTIRQDYEQRVQGKKLLEDLNAKLAGAEIEVEKAAMMIAPLSGDSADGIKETESALSSSQLQLSQTHRLIESKLKTLEKQKGPVYEEIKVLQDRTKAAQEKLDEVRKDLKEQQVRAASSQLLKEVNEKVTLAEDELQRMSDAELPYMKSDPKGAELDTLIEETDAIAAKVHGALADAQAFVARKLVEVARFSEGHAKSVKEELDGLQKRLEDGRNRLQMFKGNCSDRKRTHLLQEVEEKVKTAEIDLQRMTDLAGNLTSIGKAGQAVPEGLQDTLEQAALAERGAQASIVVARKVLLQKTAELKKLSITGAGSGAELGRFQTRVNNVQQEIARLRTASKDAEERMRVKQMLLEVVSRLQATEVEVDKVASSAVLPADGEALEADDVDRMDKAAAAAQLKVTAIFKLMDIKLKNAQGFLREELTAMRARASEAEQKLDKIIKAAAQQKERMTVDLIKAQAVEKVEQAEQHLREMAEAELPFLKGIETLDTKDAGDAIAACEQAATLGQKAISEARTYIVEKLADMKENFSDATSRVCSKELMALQKQLDVGAGKLAELKKDTSDRKRKSQMQQCSEKISQVEASVQTLATTMTKFSEDKLADISADDARAVCLEIGNAEYEAQKAVSSTKKFLAERLKEIKSFAEGHRAAMTTSLSKQQSRLTQCQVELAKLSKTCTEREQRYVAQKLIKDIDSTLVKLGEEIEAASKVGAPLLADESQNNAELLGSLYLQTFTGALQSYMKSSGTTMTRLFTTITSKESATFEDFTAFLDKLVELTGKEDLTFTEAQRTDIYKRVKTSATMSVSDFKALFKECYTCTQRVALTSELKGETEITSIEPGEAITVVETKSDDDGVNFRCALARDGTSGWTALKSSDGAMNFKPSMGGAPPLESMFAYIDGIHSRCKEVSEHIEQKTTEVAGVKQGPLAEVKAKLLQLRMRASQEQLKIDQLKTNAADAHDKIVGKYKAEIEDTLVARCKAFAERTMKDARQAAEAAETKAAKAMEIAKLGHEGKSMVELEPICTAYTVAMQSLADAKKVFASIQEKHTAFRGTKNVLLEARVELTKLRTQAETREKKCTEGTKLAREAYDKQVGEICTKARTEIRVAARKAGKSSHKTFADLIGKGTELTQAQFGKYVKSLKVAGVSDNDVSLLYGKSKPTSWLGFSSLVHEYAKCEKGVAITDKFDIAGDFTTLRKLNEKETFEILEGPKQDPDSQVERVRGRALRDGVTGWVSVKGNQGSLFLKTTTKPFMQCNGEASLQESFDSSSAVVRPLKVGEAFELIEGPREQEVEANMFLQGTAAKDGKKGWITLRSSVGVESATNSKDFYVCKSVVGMTDVFDVKEGKVVKKVEPGEVLEVMASEHKDGSADLTRLKFKSADGKEGWVTLTGNQGTVYMEPSTSHYRITKEITLRSGAAADAAVVRTLQAGEGFEAPEAPMEEKTTPHFGVLARAVDDQKQGWIVWQGKSPVGPYKKA